MTNKWFQRAALLFALLVCFIGLGISHTSDAEINKNEGEEIKARLALQLSGDLPSIRTTYSDLQRFSEDITQMIVKANGYDPNKSKTGPFTRWRYEVEDPETSISGRSVKGLLQSDLLPNPAYEFSIDFSDTAPTPLTGPLY